VILADPNTEIFQHLIKVYQGVSDKYIESYLWVKKCVEKGTVVYTPLVYKNPGGRRPGEEFDISFSIHVLWLLTDVAFIRRTQFTDEDEEHLCNWIAAKIPYKETGGRTGNRLYQQLCDLVRFPPSCYENISLCLLIEHRSGIRMGFATHLAIMARTIQEEFCASRCSDSWHSRSEETYPRRKGPVRLRSSS
jgi:hypothetical protein